MSNLSHSLVEDISHLYRNISSQDYSYLDEASQHYDEELKNLVEDIVASISLEMIYEGYSANAALDFLSYSLDEEIIEKYLGFDENIISESVVSEEYIEEQLILINEAIGSALGLLGKAMFGAGARRTLSVATKRAMGPGARKAIKGAVTKVKDIAVKTKEALPKIAKGAAAGAGALGLGAAGGYIGAKAAGAGSDKSSAETSKPSSADSAKWSASKALGGEAAFKAGGGAAKMKMNPEMTAADVQKLGMKNLKSKSSSSTPSSTPSSDSSAGSGSSGGGGGGSTPAPSAKPAPVPAAKSQEQSQAQNDSEINKKYDELRKTDPEAAVKYGKEQWAKKYGQPTTGPEATEAQKTEAGKDVKAEIERQQEKMKKEQEKNKEKTEASTKSESYEPYDLVLEYLLSQGHVDTVEEANYVMLEMDAETIQSIVEDYQ
jgi:hypothetical protein